MSPLDTLAAKHAGLSRNVQGAIWMLLAAMTFTVSTVLVKFLGHAYSPALQTFYRQVAGLIFMIPLVMRMPLSAFKSSQPGILAWRAFAGFLGITFSFYAYQEMPLAEANALVFTRSLWVVPLAAFVLHERIGPWRLGASLFGFIGVLVMLRPSPTGFHVGLPELAALASAALLATTVTGMKVLTRDHSATVILVWSGVLGLILSLPIAIMEWRWPTPVDLALLAAMGALGQTTQALYIKGMAVGDAAAMAPIDYTRIVFAVVIGFFLFRETPDAIAMLGAGIVILSTLVITLREARLAKPKPPAPAPES